MTLITYVTRIHFADGVLEEALWSEIKANKKKRPLVVTTSETLDDQISERLFASFPVRTSIEVFSEVPSFPTEEAAKNLAKFYRTNNCDVLIALGSGNAIDLAKAARISIEHDEQSLSTFSHTQGGSRRIANTLPDLYAVPNISGFGAAVSAHTSVLMSSGERELLMCKKLIPTVTICDPTITIGASAQLTASAGADAIARCIEAYLSRGYNPPADGIALDGLSRAVHHLHRVLKTDSIESRREMMAASLNGALALQKGLGATNAINTALETVLGKSIDPGALSRLVLPAVLRFNADTAKEKYQTIRHLLEIAPKQSLADGLKAFLEDLPLPEKLSEMGLNMNQISAAAPLAAHDLASVTNPRVADTNDLLSIMQSVH
ncbi:MAG: iron-containing alcohol dehydrogenase [Hyphomicrobiales bacterium]